MKLLSIGEMAKLTGFSVSKLRYYHDIGLLRAHYIDNETNYRYYAPEQLYETNFISEWKEMGFSIKDILKITNENSFLSIKASFKEKEAEISRQILNLMEKKEIVNEKIKILDLLSANNLNKNNLNLKEVIREKEYIIYPDNQPDKTLEYSCFSQSKNSIFSLLNKYKFKSAGTPAFRVMIDKYPTNIITSQVKYGLGLLEEPEIKYSFVKKLEKRRILKTYYYGSIANPTIIDIYFEELRKKIYSLGYSITGEITLIFIVNSWITNDKSKHITEIQIPI